MAYGPTKRQSDCSYIALHLPSWGVRFDGYSLTYIAKSPRFEEDGVEVRHKDAQEVVALAQVLMLNWRPGSGLHETESQPATRPPAVREDDGESPSRHLTVDPPEHLESYRPPSGLKAYTGECCSNCGSAYVVRTGSCSTCQSCGTTTSCG